GYLITSAYASASQRSRRHAEPQWTNLAIQDLYQPSAAFVAQQAASLMVGALIARTHPGGNRVPIRQIEYDTLYGPRPDMVDDRRPRSDCYCQTNPDVIRLVRAQRAKNILTR
ncbi:hypothetical protein AB0873_28880, partial [Micromonospora sp. NPDC047707]|uniref:hypothetical protein n=1 Tax=Micromonospora sp. NPDC047707 TaxID=3154498 RepID=UPI003454A551